MDRKCECCENILDKYTRRKRCGQCIFAKKPKKFEDKICEWCGKLFCCDTSHHQKYCSAKCRQEKQNYKNQVKDRYIIFERDGFRCSYCGRNSVEDNVKLVADHIYPYSRGGKNRADNMLTACEDCNAQKHNRKMTKETRNLVVAEVKKRNKKCGILDDQIIKTGYRTNH